MQNFFKFKFLFYVECFFQELGEIKKIFQYDIQLNFVFFFNWFEVVIVGFFGVFLLNLQERLQDDFLISSNSCCDNFIYVLLKLNGDQLLREVV